MTDEEIRSRLREALDEIAKRFEWRNVGRVGFCYRPDHEQRVRFSEENAPTLTTVVRDLLSAETQQIREALEQATAVLDDKAPLDEGQTKTLAQRVADEMADYYVVAEHCSYAYDYISRGRISKPFTMWKAVESEGDDALSRDINEAVAEETEELKARAEQAEAETQQIREELAELRQRDKVISRQLERRASGMDPVTQGERARADEAESKLKHAEAETLALRAALDKSVSTQSHYADQLNMHDGGRRILFKNADEWLQRLQRLAPAAATPVATEDVPDYVAAFDELYGSAKELVGIPLEQLIREMRGEDEAAERPVPTCQWTEDEDGVFQTACGHAFFFDSGTPRENKMAFCGYCGKTLDEVLHAPLDGGPTT